MKKEDYDNIEENAFSKEREKPQDITNPKEISDEEVEKETVKINPDGNIRERG